MQIKFSHCYPKLHGQKQARLVDIELYDRADMTDKFIEYDTRYYTDYLMPSLDGHYPLPSGRYMILLFQGDERIPFTTVRRFTDEKYRYYHSNIGKIFDIVITEEK